MDHDNEVRRLTAARAAQVHPRPLCLGPITRALSTPSSQRRRPRLSGPPSAVSSTGAPPAASSLWRDPRPAVAVTAGPRAASTTTGTRCSRPTGSRTRGARRPIGLHRQPWAAPLGRMRDVLPVQAEPGRHGPRRLTGCVEAEGRNGQDMYRTCARRRRTCLYANPRLGHGGAACCSSPHHVQRSITDVLPTSRGQHPGTVRDPRQRGQHSGRRDDPGGGPPQVLHRHGLQAIEPAVRLFEEPTEDHVGDRVVRTASG